MSALMGYARPNCFGYGTLDAIAFQTMVLELRAEIVTLHDAMAAQQAGHGEVDSPMTAI